jgi:uncharacterized repeat protein (TIGR01451 family)
LSSHRLRRLAAVVSTSLIALMLVGPASTSAAQPGWYFENVGGPVKVIDKALVYQPDTVAPGNDAGYTFRIANRGTSNIASLYLTDLVDAVTTYVSSTRLGCSPVGAQLSCSFGALNPGDFIDITVAYTTPESGSAFAVTFQLNTTGVVVDKGSNNSHGDALNLVLSTALNGTKDFDGGFWLDPGTIANNPELGKKNIQAGEVTPPPSAVNIPVTIQDGAQVVFSCPATLPACANTFGEWTKVNVNNGATYADGIKVVIKIWGPAVPTGATVDTIDLIHVPDVGAAYTISTRCLNDSLNPDNTDVPADANSYGDECITVTKNGNIYQIVSWQLDNGGNRSSY